MRLLVFNHSNISYDKAESSFDLILIQKIWYNHFGENYFHIILILDSKVRGESYFLLEDLKSWNPCGTFRKVVEKLCSSHSALTANNERYLCENNEQLTWDSSTKHYEYALKGNFFFLVNTFLLQWISWWEETWRAQTRVTKYVRPAAPIWCCKYKCRKFVVTFGTEISV